MLPEYILIIYAIFIGIICRVFYQFFYNNVSKIIVGDDKLIRARFVLKKVIRISILVGIISIAIWVYVNIYLFEGSSDSLMTGVCLLGAISVTIIVPSITILNSIKRLSV